MTSKIVVNNIEADSGINTVAFNDQIKVGSETTIHSTGIDLGSGNINSHNLNSTGIVTAIGLDISGNVSIAGTLTYQDVTNIDAVGIITAQSGIHVTGGSVGIGTDNPFAKLHVNITSPTTVPAAGSNSHPVVIGDVGFGAAIGALHNGKSYIQGTRWDGTATNYSLLLNPNGGSIGIGTTNPSSTGSNYGSLDISGSSGGEIFLSEDGTSKGNLFNYSADTNLVGLAAVNASGQLLFSTGGYIERLRITSAGNVGIGLTNPDLKLHVNGTNGLPATSGSTPTGHISVRAKSSGSSHGFHMGVSNAAPWSSWIQAQDANNLATEYPLLLNPNGGNVGVGTDNPVVKLDIVDSGSPNIALRGSSYPSIRYSALDGTTDAEIYYGISGNDLVLNNVNAGPTVLKTNNVERLRITDDGNVSINNTGTNRARLDLRQASGHPAFNIGFPDGSFYRNLGTVGPESSDGSTGNYLHIRLRTTWNDASMTMFRLTGYYPYSAYTESYVGMYRYAHPSYRTNPYGQVISNQSRATVHSVYNTTADPGYLVIVCDYSVMYNGLMIEHIGAGSVYASYMQYDLEIIDTKRSSGTSAQW